jgi:hypothetical protein
MPKKPKERIREQLDREAMLSYLHHRGTALTAEQEIAIDAAIDEAIMLSNPKSIARVFRLSTVDDKVEIEGGPILTTKDLARTLRGSENVVVVACTLGHEVVRQIKRHMITRPSEGVLLDAAASALVEALAQVVHRDLPRPEGYAVGTRYSPGYGDLTLEHQEELLELIGAQQKLGIHTNTGHLMIPEKSILYLAGIGPEGRINTEAHCNHQCTTCDTKACRMGRSPL